ncbi:unnamed protein product [Effrenium voratum]|nr:unnamed protein product [Effrenium voratum]
MSCLDRSGKSTQSKKLEAHLQKVGYGKVKWMCFPNRKTAIGTAIDLYLRRQLELPDEAVHRLFSANRWEMAKSIVEDLKAGTTIICDRYAFSGVAYSAAKGLDFTWCQSPDRGLPCPDGIFFLYIDEKVGASRANFGDERYENAEMQAEVRNQFKDPRLRAHVNWHDVDGARDKEVIHAEILAAVQKCKEMQSSPIRELWIGSKWGSAGLLVTGLGFAQLVSPKPCFRLAAGLSGKRYHIVSAAQFLCLAVHSRCV